MPAYSIVHNTATWCFHRMTTGATLDGTAPRTATTNEASTYPDVKGGVASFNDLTKGGLFTLVANARKPLVVEAISNPGSATITLVDRNNASVSRAAPTAPFHVAANEVIKVVGGTSGGSVGFLYRIEGEKIL